MKKIRFSLPALALVLGIAASAFTDKPMKAETDSQEFHWFAPDGQYFGKLTVDDADDLCPDGSNEICLTPYNTITGEEGEEQPVGSPSGDPLMRQ